MKTTNSLALVLALALGALATGCGTDPAAMPGGGDDDGGGGGDDTPPPPPRPLDATGKYAMHSTFDLATNMPGTAGTVVNTIIAATDDSDDPTRWIIDQIISQLPEGPVRTALNGGKIFVTDYLNRRLLDIAPDFVTTMVQVGHDFGDIAKHFGLNETLELTKVGNDYVAVHTISGAHFKIGNQERDYLLVTYRVPDVVVRDVPVTMASNGQLTIAAHKLTMPYGRILRLGLDAAIIPLIDSSAHNLGELLAHHINCDAVGTAIGEALSFGTAAFKAACHSGLAAGANYVYARIDAIDGAALEFGINGSALGADNNHDRTIDAIQTGTWAGTLTYAGTPTPLLPATFFGERM